jgi:glycosyltransferase involved in cell wall biosynthesis
VRLLIFHGYLLRGTGSNVYNARLAAALAGQGHEVHLLCQEDRPDEVRLPPGVILHRPDIGRLLPVYVADRYEGFDAKTFLECTDEEIEAYVEANVRAVREVAAQVAPDAALANHLVMGPAILARGLEARTPYAVTVHGSALEYVVKRDPARFLPWAREGLEGASGVLVGSRHTAESLWAAMGDPSLPARTRLGPPGVDVDEFRPRPRAEAASGVRALAARLSAAPPPEPGAAETAFSRDEPAIGRALARLDPEAERQVGFVGKLIVSKGVDLLAAAWPLVLDRVPDARLVVVGFGAYRATFERLLGALRDGDLATVRAVALEGRAAEGGPREPLRHLLAFLDSLAGEERDAYLRAAARLDDRVVVVGRLEHDELVDLLALWEAQVVPSTFPEAFGMVAAEAAACGVLPVSAAHSGLAEVTRTLAAAVPEAARAGLSFEVGPDAVRELARDLVAWLEAGEDLRARTRGALVESARERYSWEGVARGVVAAARGQLAGLPVPS